MPAALVHKSIAILPQVWRRLRINAELSGVSLRDYLTFLVERSEPVAEKDTEAMRILAEVARSNQEAVKTAASGSPSPAP